MKMLKIILKKEFSKKIFIWNFLDSLEKMILVENEIGNCKIINLLKDGEEVCEMREKLVNFQTELQNCISVPVCCDLDFSENVYIQFYEKIKNFIFPNFILYLGELDDLTEITNFTHNLNYHFLNIEDLLYLVDDKGREYFSDYVYNYFNHCNYSKVLVYLNPQKINKNWKLFISLIKTSTQLIFYENPEYKSSLQESFSSSDNKIDWILLNSHFKNIEKIFYQNYENKLIVYDNMISDEIKNSIKQHNYIIKDYYHINKIVQQDLSNKNQNSCQRSKFLSDAQTLTLKILKNSFIEILFSKKNLFLLNCEYSPYLLNQLQISLKNIDTIILKNNSDNEISFDSKYSSISCFLKDKQTCIMKPDFNLDKLFYLNSSPNHYGILIGAPLSGKKTVLKEFKKKLNFEVNC